MIISIDNISTKLTIGGSDFIVDPDLLKHLREYLSIKVPGSFFANKYLKYHWDGMKYFLSKRGVMATGFLPPLLKYLDQEYPDLSVEIEDLREYVPKFKGTFVGKVKDRELFPHQIDTVKAYKNYISFRGYDIYFPRGVADDATNAGKTTIMAAIYLNLVQEERMLIVIHRKTIYKELVTYFKSVFGDVGEINADKYDIKPITIAMINTLYSHRDNETFIADMATFTVLAVDESHRAGSDMYAKVLVHCHAGVRIFLSGSPFDSEDIVGNMVIVGLSGPKLIKVSKRYLMDHGISTPVKIKIHLCNTILRAPIIQYDDCMDNLIYYSVERVSLINKIIDERSSLGPILIAVERTEHGEYLQSMLANMGKKVELTHSKDKELIAKIEAFRDNGIDVLISTGVLKEGVNLPMIQTIILASGGKSGAYIKQWCGRGERIHSSKTEVELHDFYDIGKFVQKHSMFRISLYKAEELEVSYNFDMKQTKGLKNIIIQ